LASAEIHRLLASLNSAASVVGAVIYAPLSRRMPLRRLLNWSIGVGVAGTLCYLVYRGRVSAVAIDTFFGCVGMIMQLAFLDLAARPAAPGGGDLLRLLMSVYNTGRSSRKNVGARLYETYGYTPPGVDLRRHDRAGVGAGPLLDVDRGSRGRRRARPPTRPPSPRRGSPRPALLPLHRLHDGVVASPQPPDGAAHVARGFHHASTQPRAAKRRCGLKPGTRSARR
jgi:hypothetical protein